MNAGIPFPPLPGFDGNGPFWNPGQTQPWPLPQNTPVGTWETNEVPLTWTAGASPVDPSAVVHAIWRSPVFNLRPERRNVGPAPSIDSTPIWRGGAGAGGQAFVRLSGMRSLPDACTNLTIHSTEFGHPWSPTAVASIMSVADVTMDFIDIVDTSIVPFMPPGSGYPLAFWQLILTFGFTSVHAAYPALSVTCAYY